MKVVETALALASLGYHVVPLRARTKFPEDRNFLNFRITPNEVSKYFDTAREWNIGVILGTDIRGSYLLALDIDVEDESIIGRVKLAIPGEPVSKRGKKGVTFIVRTAYPVKSATFSRKDPISGKRFTAIDLLGAGKQTVIPPSIHPEGVPYAWLSLVTLEDVAIERLPLLTEWDVYEIRLAVIKPDSPWFLINDMAWYGSGKGGTVDDSLLRATGAMLEAGAPDDFIRARCRRAVDVMLQVHGRYDWNGDVYERRLRNLIDDGRKKGFDASSDKKRDRIVVMAEHLIAIYGGRDNVRRLPAGGMRAYRDGHWPPLVTEEIELRIAGEFHVQARDIDATIRTAIKNLQLWPKLRAAHKIRLLNGTYDPLAQTFSTDGSPDDYLLYCLPFEYGAEAVCPAYDRFIRRAFEQVGDKPEEELLMDRDRSIDCFEEFVGLTMVENLQFQKCLMIIGAPDTGKSTMGHLIRMLHHPSAVGATNVAQLADERTRTAMVGKLVTLSNEVSSMSQITDDIFKAIIGGDEVSVRKLYEEETRTVISARVVIIGNDAFRFSDDSGAVEKRLLYLRCDKRLREDEIDRNLQDKLRDELPGIFNRVMRALMRLYSRGNFDPPDRAKTSVKEMGEENNPIYQFLIDNTHEGLKMAHPDYEMPDGDERPHHIESLQVYLRYAEWAKANGHKQMSNVTFGLRLTRAGFPSLVKWVGGRPVRCRNLAFLNQHREF